MRHNNTDQTRRTSDSQTPRPETQSREPLPVNLAEGELGGSFREAAGLETLFLAVVVAAEAGLEVVAEMEVTVASPAERRASGLPD